MILPPATLGMLGGGQLGRMFCMAAQSLGYKVCVLDPGRDSPAGAVADDHLCADYFDESALAHHLAAGTTFEDFFAAATINPNATLIKGVVCGIRVENIEDPLMQQIRYLDKLVDELAKGKPLPKILRV